MKGLTEQQEQMVQKAIVVEVEQPPTDYTFLWVSGVIVPIVIAAVGWWIQHKRHKKDIRYKHPTIPPKPRRKK